MSQSIFAKMQGLSELSWDEVRLFLGLCRSRTLAEAGRRIGVDASTMSRRLAALERGLSATLFERGRSGIRPTEAAEQLLPVAEEMEHVMARFTGQAEAFERNVAGNVRIACPADAADAMLMPLVPPLLERYPGLRVEIIAGENVVDMARREADIALRTARPASGDLMVTRLLHVDWSLAAAPHLVQETGSLKRWNDVRWIGCSRSMEHTTPGRWYQTHISSSVDSAPIVRSDSLTVQIAAVAAGLGVALIPSLSVTHYGLVELPLSRGLQRKCGDLPRDELFLVCNRATRSVPRVRAVWDFLRREVPSEL